MKRTRLLIVVLLLNLMSGCGPGVGQTAPEFSMPDLEGRMHSLADYQGEVVLLDFWATWCPPCLTSSPAVQRLHERFAAQGLNVLAVHYDDNGNPSQYMADHEYTYTVLPDANEICQLYKVSQIPTFIIIGVDGTVLHRQTGFPKGSEEKMAGIIERELTPKG